MKMQLKAAALVVSFLTTSVFGSAFPYAEDCSAKDHPCNVYGQYPTCGPEWTKYIDACIATGCIKWVRDPKADCNIPCDAENHPCNTYHKFEQCSPEWEEVLDQCIASKCIVWIRDPKADCPTCDSKKHPCNTYGLYPECSAEWVADLKKCMPSGCIFWIRDPLEVCEEKPTEKRKVVDCASPKHPCNTYTLYPECSDSWFTDIKKCIPTGCINWFRDPLEVCEEKPIAKREVDCSSPKHPCNTYSSYPECSDSWLTDIKECIPTGCINWFDDPLAVCDAKPVAKRVAECTSPKHPCNTYNNYKQCSPQWESTLDQCIASGCLYWIRDPKAVCYGGGDIKA